MKKIIRYLAYPILVLALAGCAAASSGGGNLPGTNWVLTDLAGTAPVAGSSITAQFGADGRLSGSAGCNQYSGAYTVSGSSLQISQLISTMMACEAALMDQEGIYLKTLEQVKSFAITGDRLVLKDASGKALLTYQVQSQDLAGSSWNVTGYNNGKQAVVSVLAETTLTAEFSAEGTVSGNGGCNTFSGPYKVTGNQITIGPLASTLMACAEPAGVMEQEAQYLAALQSAATYTIQGGQLEMRTKDDAMAVNFSRK